MTAVLVLTTGTETGSEQPLKNRTNVFPATATVGAVSAGSTRSCTTTRSREAEVNVLTVKATEGVPTVRSANRTPSPPPRRTPKEGRSASCATATRTARQTFSAGMMGSVSASPEWLERSAISALPTTGTSPDRQTLAASPASAWLRAVLEIAPSATQKTANVSASRTSRDGSVTGAGRATSRSTWTTTLVAHLASALVTPPTATQPPTISKA